MIPDPSGACDAALVRDQAKEKERMKQGITTRKPQWWKHLRAYNKRKFWKKQRKADTLALRKDKED